MTETITDFASADKVLHRRSKGDYTNHPVRQRKVGNNTYLHRIDETAIAVRYHDTNVVTYYRDGSVQLRTDGWFTMTTKDRINRFTPACVCVHSVKRRWRITTETVLATYKTVLGTHYINRPDFDSAVPFFDGMLLVP